MTVRRPVIVQLAALGWSYAVVAVFLRTFSLPTRAEVESCIAPPPEILGALVGEAGFNTGRPVVMANATGQVDPQTFSWMFERPWVDSANGGVAAALAALVGCSHVQFSLDSQAIARSGAQLLVRSPEPTSFLAPKRSTVMTVSAVGLSPDSSIAILYWTYDCGPLCGGSIIAMFFRGFAGKWVPWHSQILSVS
jgi:hypothetical protein